VHFWWGYVTAADMQRFEALIRRAIRVGLYPVDGPNLREYTPREYRRMNIMYYNNCYSPLPVNVINRF